MVIIIGITEKEVIALKAENEELKALVAKQASQIEYLTKQLFCSKSEKLDPNQSELFGEGEETGIQA